MAKNINDPEYIEDRVTTIFGEKGIVDVMCLNNAENQYSVILENGEERWFKQSELVSGWDND